MGADFRFRFLRADFRIWANNLFPTLPAVYLQRVSLAMAHSEADLERQAMEEILRESKRGAERAKESGAYGWERPRLHPTNKVFLRNTVLSTLPSRRRLQSSSKTSVKDRASNGRAESEHRKRERRDSPGKSETDKKRRDEDGRPVSKAQSTRAK